MIPAPHGGRLVHRQLGPREVERWTQELPELPTIQLDAGQAFDAEKLGIGAYSPLDGFLDAAALEDVASIGRLPGGLPWPVPIFLAPTGRENAQAIGQVEAGDDVALVGPSGRFVAVLHLREKYRLPKLEIARHVFDTTSTSHPDVAALRATGETALAGRVDLLRPPEMPLPELELTPAATREMFRARGWRTVAAYHARNVPHLGHEQMQRLTLERNDIDGLFVHPVLAPRTATDFAPEVVVATYRALIDGYYPTNRVALATLTMSMRFAGPRGALFLAIVRQNYGCSHYVVGPDQAGIDGLYDPYACHRIFDNFPLEITPIRYRSLAYCTVCRGMVSDKTCGHPPEHRIRTDQALVRRALEERRPLPEEIVRPEVLAILQGGTIPRPDASRDAREPPVPEPERAASLVSRSGSPGRPARAL